MIWKTFRMNEQPVSKILFKGDWGCCPNKQFEQTCTGLPCLPLCANLKWQRNYSRIGNNFSALPVANLSTSWNFLSLFLTCAQLGYKWFWKTLRSYLFPIWGQAKYQIPHLSPSWREVFSCQFGTKPKTIATKMTSVRFVQKLFFIPDELAGISLSDNSSGSCAATLDQLGRDRFKFCVNSKNWYKICH